ncbi:MAG: barstar family protein [Clostridiales bacterium]|jgi:ribonuclease inhibitor|nr:barstar family protein [Clostridiales bacterium]
MKTVIIDGRDLTSRERAHAHIAEKLSFPDHYGGNLDALHDCLAEIGEPTQIIINHADEIVAALGTYGTALLRVLEISARETGMLTVCTDSCGCPDTQSRD